MKYSDITVGQIVTVSLSICSYVRVYFYVCAFMCLCMRVCGLCIRAVW